MFYISYLSLIGILLLFNYAKKSLLPATFRNAVAVPKRIGGSRFLTEFGLCGDDDNPLSVNTIECDLILQEADKHFESWTYWDDNFINDDGHKMQSQIKAFSRTYPKSTFGKPKTMYFNYRTGNFNYSFIAKQKGSKQEEELILEIFTPMETHYPNGVKVLIKPSELKSIRRGNIFSIYVPTQMIYDFLNVEIVMTRI